MRSLLALIVFALLWLVSANADPKTDLREVRCLVCKAVVDEMDKAVDKVDPNRKLSIGGYSLDSFGKEQKAILYARSEFYLEDVLEEVCNQMKNYVRVQFKSNSVLALLRVVDDSGSLNPLLSEVDPIHDENLSVSIKNYCDAIVEEFDEQIFKLYANHSENMKTRLCVDSTNLCPSSADDDAKSYHYPIERHEL